MFGFRRGSVWGAGVILLAAQLLAGPSARADDEADGLLRAYAARLPALRTALSDIAAAAEAAAERRTRQPEAALFVCREPDAGFAHELTSRAGGLAELRHERARWRGATPSDVALVSIPAWEEADDSARTALEWQRKRGALVVLFASRADMPQGYPADCVIDNGAASGAAAASTMNALVNASAGWLWCCEYTAALTRLGKRPGILKSIAYPDGREFNAELRTTPRRLYDYAGAPIARLGLGEVYLARLGRLTQEIASPEVRLPLKRAAETISERLRAGGRVYAATCTHLLGQSIFRGNRSTLLPFSPYDGGFARTLKEGDLLLWVGYMGMDTANYAHGAEIRKTKADFIACFAPSEKGDAEAPDARVVVPQSWTLGDSEVAIPFAPGRMGPISGINAALIYRMIDAAAAERSAPRAEK